MSVRGLDVNMSVFSVFLQPRQEISVAVGDPGELRVAGDGLEHQLTALAWHIKAPLKPGLYPLDISSRDGQRQTRLNVFVLIPMEAVTDEKLKGYRIGTYPPPNPRRAEYYPLPAGFIEVTADIVDVKISPHFTLRQFLCKQPSDYPKFVVLREKLIYLLEDVLVAVRSAGFEVNGFGFISGYRTPWYNKSIGNVKYSRHVYGDAADIFVDEDGDGRMDDLNDDGAVNRADVQLFFKVIENYRESHSANNYVGGMGLYQGNSRHDGFVHVDTRGYRARW